MTSTSHPVAPPHDGSGAMDAACSQQQEQAVYSIEVTRMMGLETAADMLGGKGKLADALGMSIRSINYKLSGERGVSALDLKLTARALAAEGNRLIAHARKLLDVAANGEVTR